MKRILKFFFDLPKNLALSLIILYQRLLSPDHSWLRGRFVNGFCRFYPSCSEYARVAISRFGFMKGSFLAGKRVLRCHPWAESKIDQVPNL